MAWENPAMNWWSRNKKILILVSIGLLLLTGVVIVVAVLAGPVIGCTLVGCVGGLDITLTGLSTSNYQISLTFPSGETKTLNCGSNVADESVAFEKSCSSDGAFFRLDPDTAPPKKVTVTVVVDGKAFSQDFSPKYEKFQPNGKNCPPTCYNATIEMKITP
jgi:hypothetical protein